MNILAILFEVYGKIKNKQTTKLEIHIKEISIEDGVEYTTESFIIKQINNQIITKPSQNNFLLENKETKSIEDKETKSIEDNYPDMGKILRNHRSIKR